MLERYVIERAPEYGDRNIPQMEAMPIMSIDELRKAILHDLETVSIELLESTRDCIKLSSSDLLASVIIHWKPRGRHVSTIDIEEPLYLPVDIFMPELLKARQDLLDMDVYYIEFGNVSLPFDIKILFENPKVYHSYATVFCGWLSVIMAEIKDRRKKVVEETGNAIEKDKERRLEEITKLSKDIRSLGKLMDSKE